ncbi:hypothetical protein [Actinomadura sp. NPDC048394]|uniref:hypothetical protein n=1 Tax=Actinomadura sp. NPDC048394 TaxID=3158223 RepID=UPI0033C764F3
MRFMKLGLSVGIAATALIAGLQAPASAEEYLWTTGGYGLWQADPENGRPGDSIKACDTSSDGWAISVVMTWGTTGYRQVDTRGHESGYCSGWASGDLPEGTYVDISVEEIKSDGQGGLLHRNWQLFRDRVA